MSTIYDLHCHSDQSDGILSPEALVSRAKAQTVDVLALTDHDTLNGWRRAHQRAAHEHLTLICGVEFSSQWNGRGGHIVGLAIEPNASVIRDAVEYQLRIRFQRAELIAHKLEKMGVSGA